VYRVSVKAVLTDEMIAKVRKGMWIGDGMVKMLKIHSSKAGAGAPGAWYEIELMEGRNRVVRRIFETLRIEIRRTRSRWLQRVRLPSGLEPGDCKPLTPAQVKELRTLVGLPSNVTVFQHANKIRDSPNQLIPC
jgi:23S rRNA pseudouridine2605 synthase